MAAAVVLAIYTAGYTLPSGTPATTGQLVTASNALAATEALAL